MGWYDCFKWLNGYSNKPSVTVKESCWSSFKDKTTVTAEQRFPCCSRDFLERKDKPMWGISLTAHDNSLLLVFTQTKVSVQIYDTVEMLICSNLPGNSLILYEMQYKPKLAWHEILRKLWFTVDVFTLRWEIFAVWIYYPGSHSEVSVWL